MTLVAWLWASSKQRLMLSGVLMATKSVVTIPAELAFWIADLGTAM
jgi:hypothetical protein